jgi:hypothetical protein
VRRTRVSSYVDTTTQVVNSGVTTKGRVTAAKILATGLIFESATPIRPVEDCALIQIHEGVMIASRISIRRVVISFCIDKDFVEETGKVTPCKGEVEISSRCC